MTPRLEGLRHRRHQILGTLAAGLQLGTRGHRDHPLRSRISRVQGSLSLDSAFGLFLLAVVANIAYCAAYIPDIFAQASGFREIWQRYRWLLFAIGTTFAAIITHFVAMGIFHPVKEY